MFAGLACVTALRFSLSTRAHSPATELRRAANALPVNIAHRGGSALAPENTLEAFGEGLEAGAEALELDVHMTADGELAVIHDATVDRTTDGSGAVKDMTLQQLKQLDAGYWYTRDGGKTYPYRGRGICIPTLPEVYSRFPEAAVNVDIKQARPGVEEAVLAVIQNAGAGNRTLVASEDTGTLHRFRRISGGKVATGASGAEIRIFYLFSKLHLQDILRPGYSALQVPPSYRGIEVLTPGFVEAAHGMGVRVDVWTIDNLAQMHEVIDRGVDGIITDRPDVLFKVFKERRTGA